MGIVSGPPRRPAWLYPEGTVWERRKTGERWIVCTGYVDDFKYWDRVKENVS